LCGHFDSGLTQFFLIDYPDNLALRRPRRNEAGGDFRDRIAILFQWVLSLRKAVRIDERIRPENTP
jgi:hypothetical protein